MCKIFRSCELAISHFIRESWKIVIRAKALLCFWHTMHCSVEAPIENARAPSLTGHWWSFLVQFFRILVSQFSQVVVLAKISNRRSAQACCLGLLALPKCQYLTIIIYSGMLRCCHLMVVLDFLDQKVFDSSVVVTVQINTARHYNFNNGSNFKTF